MKKHVVKFPGNSFLIHLPGFVGFIGLVLFSLSAQAMNTDAIQFRGQIIDGPFKEQRVSGVCIRDPNGNLYKQKTRCVMKMKGGYKIVDTNASLEVVGGFRALRIIMGPSMNAKNQKGNHKLSAFQVTTFYDRKITLFDFPKEFSAVEMSIGGVSVAGGTSTTNPDCLIWDIAGDGVFN